MTGYLPAFEHYYAVIMAGGGGTRLWPLSRQTRPKQLLSLFDERSLYQASVQRLSGLIPPERILVVAMPDLARQLHAQTPEIPYENFLQEPAARGTASVVGLAAAALHKRDPQASMAILTADHYIRDEELFRQYLQAAYAAVQDDYLVTLGIEPGFAATGFGYIQRGQALGEYGGSQAYQVLRFKEKPDLPTAQAMIASGDHVWNSGMFFWRAGRILKEFERQMPELAAGLVEIENAWDTPVQQETLQRVWQTLTPQTIDYGIMENAQQAAVIPAAGLGWSDVGSWDALFDFLECDTDHNVLMGAPQIVSLDTHDCLIYMSQERRLIVTIGVEDLVVVDAGDVLLVCRKDQAQRVRQVVSQLQKDGQDYL